jgi:HTH-type transcriptional regulator, fmd operon transcriptional regulator
MVAMRSDEKDIFLTDKQIEILKLKKKGLSQADIARKLKTTRGNICIIEGTAQKNIEKAKNTLKLFKTLEAPVWVTIASGMDIYDVPGLLFREADKKHIKVAVDSAMVIVKIKTEVPDKVRGRITLNEIDISSDEAGNITVY